MPKQIFGHQTHIREQHYFVQQLLISNKTNHRNSICVLSTGKPDLRRLERRYDSCLLWFNDYKIALQALGNGLQSRHWIPLRDIVQTLKRWLLASLIFSRHSLVWDINASRQSIGGDWVLRNQMMADKLYQHWCWIKCVARTRDFRFRIERTGMQQRGKLRQLGSRNLTLYSSPMDVCVLPHQ